MTNCRNCGAPLSGCVCEYCGTYYPELQTVVVAACESVEVVEPGVFKPEPGAAYQIPPDVLVSELDAVVDSFCAVARASTFSLSDVADATNRMVFDGGHVGVVCPIRGEPDGPIGNRTWKRLLTGLRRVCHE